jgi:hypothetical protein
MDAAEFVRTLDNWTERGGPFPRPRQHDLTTAAEAEALCRAVASPHIYTRGEFGPSALFDLMECFQASESREASFHLRDHGLPILRKILIGALRDARPDSGTSDDAVIHERRKAHLFVVKVLCAYQQRGDAALIVQAARDPDLAGGYLWGTIFGMTAERHPEAAEICVRLADPLPSGEIITAYLDFANRLSRAGAIERHPFDSVAGLARLSAWLSDRGDEFAAAAVGAASSIPFLDSSAREPLLELASRHSDGLVRLEEAWARTKLGQESGRARLVEFCRDPRYFERAACYLDELGLGHLIPPETDQPDFVALAEMSRWLAHPMEFGRPPDEIVEYDTRELNWPPTGRRHRFWLFKFHYEARDGEPVHDGIGLVGSDTFALHITSATLAPEDVYGLHCCFEMQGDPRIPKDPDDWSAGAGRELIAAINPGFPEA